MPWLSGLDDIAIKHRDFFTEHLPRHIILGDYQKIHQHRFVYPVEGLNNHVMDYNENHIPRFDHGSYRYPQQLIPSIMHQW